MDSDDKWNAAANRIDAACAELHRIADLLAQALTLYQAEKAAQAEAIKQDRERFLVNSRAAQERFLANQQPRIDGDHKPWEPKDAEKPLIG